MQRKGIEEEGDLNRPLENVLSALDAEAFHQNIKALEGDEHQIQRLAASPIRLGWST